MDLTEIIAAAFMAGVKQQAKAEGKKAGKKTVKFVVEEGAPIAAEGINQVLRTEKKVVRKASAYSKKYGRAFKKVAPKFKTAKGGWKKDGFKRAQKAAHTAAKKMK